ncbi:HigA family addiction module antitoxin [Mangrovicella endophytica]|uniref:HigA family addiction module antitoxin n=1 Tax=Mangrovicella endophytica TaxID=2066697 RepID=UPI000C9EBE40|nr:HigA family addiction module antitoxin [Mangrovicella endophytica]
MANQAFRDPNRCPTHPGEILREDVLPSLRKSKDELAHLLRIETPVFADVLMERRPITPEIAARVGKLLGNGPGVWLRMQTEYGTWHAERDIDVSGIPTLTAA